MDDANLNGTVSLCNLGEILIISAKNGTLKSKIQTASCNSTKASRESKAKCSNSIDSLITLLVCWTMEMLLLFALQPSQSLTSTTRK